VKERCNVDISEEHPDTIFWVEVNKANTCSCYIGCDPTGPRERRVGVGARSERIWTLGILTSTLNMEAALFPKYRQHSQLPHDVYTQQQAQHQQ
jgi:hypothetical protein